MRALALLAMRNQSHAIIILLILGCLPIVCWLNVAITGFLILCKGIKGTKILPWSILPFLVLLWVDANKLNYILIITALIITVCGAFTLRATGSWSVVLVSLVPIMLFLFALFKILIPDFYIQINMISETIYQALSQQAKYSIPVTTVKELNTYIIDGVLQAFTFILSVGCLFWARSCQAHIHNPKGFNIEFYNIRLNKLSVFLLFLSIIAIKINYYFIVVVCVMTVPFFISGLSLCHSFCVAAKHKNILLALFYTSVLFLIQVMYVMTVFLACLDTIYNFRHKLLSKISNITD
jgi:hypothetical protein